MSGPITVAEYMKTSVSAPLVGYYGQFSDDQKVFGEKGDFITSPELSQVFHELANTGHKGSWQLVELGPGRAQLMNDVLNALSKFHDKDVSVHLVETSDALIDEQEKALCIYKSNNTKDTPHVRKNKSRTGVNVYWYKAIDDIPDGFTVFIANEFLDALPVHQFQKTGDTWNEIYINLTKDDNLCFMKSKGENLNTKGLIPTAIRSDSKRVTWECSPESGTVVNQIVDRITMFGGFSLLVDYGHDGTRNTHSFRAYKNHKQVDPLANPGMVDLTADVDFGYLSSLVKDRVLVYGAKEQREFLTQLGIEHRLRRLLQICKDREQQEQLIKSYNMLIGDMGEKFKAWALFPNTLKFILEQRGGPVGFSSKEKTPNE
ncbi:hypothetical protein GCK72_009595 [Caenorhabditis remanei]|uniref:Protein arginine methyltransferase NDUFAF7 n=1 Tax=Caenorhabditis remanei TaxID=31234 RepID=A0A6A5H2Y0_CAERE|nr:hypothetical protein GCK72_009595 [Caenorhabditis remanei]KAF1761339.1 hypothetical protein GCK72_009595 [Caenorhabditis remanei]